MYMVKAHFAGCQKTAHDFDNIGILNLLIRQIAIRTHTIYTGNAHKLTDSRQAGVADDRLISDHGHYLLNIYIAPT
jgi:hypothetical protein